MAHKGMGFFDNRGHFFKSPEEATISDISVLLGRIGDGDSLAPGIATMLLQRRLDLERIFVEHDEMLLAKAAMLPAAANVTPLAPKLEANAN